MSVIGRRGGSGSGLRLPFRRPCQSVHIAKRRTALAGDDTSQHGRLRVAVKRPRLSSEYSATNAWNWNYNNQDMNNNNKSNNNCVVGVRVYV